MRLRTYTDTVARLLGAAGLLLVLGAGSIEAARYAFPNSASAAVSGAGAQRYLPAAAQEATATAAAATPTTETAAEATSEPSPTSAPTEEPTVTPTEIPPTDVPPTATEPPAPTTAPTDAPPATSDPSVPSPVLAQPVIGDAPLRLDKSASTQSVVPGQSFAYRIELMSGRSGGAELRDFIDAQLEVVSATVDGGSCNLANPIVCTTTVTQGQPVVAAVTVRVRPEAPVGAQIVSQALVQDDQNFTASSGPVVVQVAALGPAVEQSAAREQSAVGEPALQQQATTPSPIVSEEEGDPIPSATPSLTPATGAATATPLVSSEESAAPPAQVPAGSPTAIVSEEGGPSTGQPAATPIIEPTRPGLSQTATSSAYPVPQTTPVSPDSPIIRPPTRPAQAVVPLPNTAATGPAAGFGFALIGFALILHGTRRVRWQDKELAARIGAFPRLRALARKIAGLQRHLADTTAKMDEHARSIAESLDDK